MEEGALSGRKGTGLFWSKNNERERSDGWGGGGKCTRAFSQDPPQLNFDHELSFWKSNLNVEDFYDPVQLYTQQSREIITLHRSNTITFNDQTRLN